MKKKTQDGNYDVLRFFANHERKQQKSIIHIIENAQEGKRSRWMVHREQLSEKVEITESQESTLGNDCSNSPPLLLSFFALSFLYLIFHMLLRPKFINSMTFYELFQNSTLKSVK